MIILEVPELIENLLRKKTHLQEAKWAAARVSQSGSVFSSVHHRWTGVDKCPTAGRVKRANKTC